MIRVDGRARFLDCPPLGDDQMLEFLKQMIKEEDNWTTLKDRGATDISYAMDDGTARFRVNIFHSRTKYAVVMRRIVTKIPRFDDLICRR